MRRNARRSSPLRAGTVHVGASRVTQPMRECFAFFSL